MNEKDITNNKRFWETVKCYLSNKTKSSKKITRIEDDDIISDKKKNAESFDISLFQTLLEFLKLYKMNVNLLLTTFLTPHQRL